MQVMVDDDLKRVVKQLHLIERQLLDGNVQPFELRQPLQDILEHKTLDQESPEDTCVCGHTRARHGGTHGWCQAYEGPADHYKMSSGLPCQCKSFRKALGSRQLFAWIDLLDLEQLLLRARMLQLGIMFFEENLEVADESSRRLIERQLPFIKAEVEAIQKAHKRQVGRTIADDDDQDFARRVHGWTTRRSNERGAFTPDRDEHRHG